MKRFLRVGRSKSSASASSPSAATLIRLVTPRPPVVHEHVEGVVRVLRDEIGGPRAEADEPTVAADHATERRRARLVAGGGDVDPFRQTGAAIEDEHVRLSVPVAVDEVRGERAECDDESAGIDRRRFAAVRRLAEGPTLTRRVRPVTLSVRKTSIVPLASAGTRFEASDENAIVRPFALTSAARLAASASPGRPDADALGDSRGAIVHEHIRHAVPVVRDQVGGRGRKRDDVPVRADRRLHARPVALHCRTTRCSPARCAALRGRARRRRSRRSGQPRTSDVAPDTKATKRPLALSTAPNVWPSASAASRAQVRATHAENDVFTENVCADRLGLRLSEEHDGRGSAESVCDPCSPPPHAQGLHGANPVRRGRRPILTASPVRPHDGRPVTR